MNEKSREYYLLDFDRCLADTDKLAEVFFDKVGAHTGITKDQLDLARRDVELSGGSFDAVAYIQDKLESSGDSQIFELIERDFIDSVRADDYLLPGARELLQKLENLQHGIMTYGGERWQRMKIAAVALDNVAALITATPKKGQLIASWQQSDSTFKLPRELNSNDQAFGSVVLIDDKAVSFRELPSNAKGYQVLPSGNVLPSQAGDLPGNVTRVETLHDIDI